MELLIQTVQEVPEWHLDAQCLGTSSEVFFPDVGRGESIKTARMVSIAKSICRVCVVREACLDHAIEVGESEGVWGGLTPRERKRFRVREGK